MFSMIYTMTLGYNLPSEIAEKLYLLRQQNKGDYQHFVIDLSFPLRYGSDVPKDIEDAKTQNIIDLLRYSEYYECKYLSIPNVGVSQNWSRVYEELKVGANDVLIGIEPDEKPLNKGYVQAMADVLLSDRKIALVSLLMKEQEQYLKDNPQSFTEENIAGHRCYVVHGTMSMAMIGFSGRFLNEIGGIPVPDGTSIYGNIESASYNEIKEHGYEWCFLADYYVEHQENVPLYREYKTAVTSGAYAGNKQIDLEAWLKTKQ